MANGRILLSLIILYLETAVLVMLSTPLSFIQPPYLGSLIALLAIVLLASYTPNLSTGYLSPFHIHLTEIAK